MGRSGAVVHRGTSRRGFTLVELLLALALTVVFLAAIYGALQTYATLTTAGRADVERAQIARAVLRKIELDLRSVVYRVPDAQAAAQSGGQAADETDPSSATGGQTPTTGTGTGTTGTGTADPTAAATGGTDGTVTEVDTASAYSGQTMGLYGDGTTLVLHISRPVRGLNYATVLDSPTDAFATSDLQSVTWFLTGAAGPGATGMVGGGQAAPQGLARMAGDRLTMNLSSQMTGPLTGAQQDPLAGAQVLAPEITALQFRYFDGTMWLPAWDSTVMGRLPQAVEVIIGFGAGTVPLSQSSPAAPVGEVYRQVVALPLTAPYTGTTTDALGGMSTTGGTTTTTTGY